MKKFFSLLLSTSVCLVTFAQNEDSIFIRRLADEILIRGNAYENLRFLTKNIGARLSGSAQMGKAEQWGLKTIVEANPDTAWLQPCMVPHWVRGGKDVALAFYNPGEKSLINKGTIRTLNVLALGNSIGTGIKGISADVIVVGSFDELETKKNQVKGKIVFYNYPFQSTFIRTFQAYGDAVRYRRNGASMAAKFGAIGVIVRSMSGSTDNHPHTGGMVYDSSYAKIPAVAIGLQDADWLAKQLQKSKVKVNLKTNGHFLPEKLGHNVIAELKGAEFPGEYITLGGHLDSWDIGEGAHDDGAGVVHTIEVLRVFKALGYKPRRTIRFVLFANEENGLRGGDKYASDALAKNEKHIFAIESDAGGFTPRGFGFTGSEQQFQKINGWQTLLCPYGGCEINRGGGGSDITPLARSQKTSLAGFMPDSQRYFDLHHARNDVFENVNKRELELGAVNIAALVYLIDKYGL